ncbi:MAG: hypothetical protein AB7R00_08890 [Kofleriaceae bacterium]
MRSKIWMSLIAAGALCGACREKTDAEDKMDEASRSAQKAQENVNEQRQDIQDEAAEAADKRNELSKEQGDVAAQGNELGQASKELAQARQQFKVSARDRLNKLDMKLNDLAMRTDASSKDVANQLRARRDALAAKIDTIDTRTNSEWQDFSKTVNDEFDAIEERARDAMD